MTITDDLENQSEPVGVPPPVTTTETEFPFHILETDEFECLCRDIVQAHGFANVHRYGISGQTQEGIDFVGDAPTGEYTAFQVKRMKELTASDLKDIVRKFAKGAMAGCTNKFVVCMSREANNRKLLDKLAELNERCSFPIELWGAEQLTHLLSDKDYLVRRYFGDDWVNKYFGTSKESNYRLSTEVSDALRRGPIEAFGLTTKVEKAECLAQTSPTEAADVYREVADGLRNHFPGHANHFDLLRAKLLKAAGNADASHDALMELAVRNLVEQAEPQLFPGVASALGDLHDAVDETRQARAAAIRFFVQWHEHPQSLQDLAQWFDTLGPDDEYAPIIAMFVTEAAVADREFDVVLDRVECLQHASERCDKSDDKQKQMALRINLAMVDAGAEETGQDLIRQAELLELPAQENAYVLLRAARKAAWEGELERAERQYRMALKLAAEANLDLDVEKALWSLTALCTIRTIEPDSVERFHEYRRTNQLALSIQGSRSYVAMNSRTRERAFMHLVKERLPDAHLWTRFRLIEAIRSGSLMDEFDSHALLARLYSQSKEPVAALEQGLLGGDYNQIKEISSRLDVWPDYLADMISSPTLWVWRGALIALEQLGDLAPIEASRRLARTLIKQLQENTNSKWTAPATIQALQAVVLEADESDLEQLMPVLERLAPREPNTYKPTDQGVSVVAARLYRFRPTFRRRSASVLAEMAVSCLESNLERAFRACGTDLGELVGALESVAGRERCDLAGPLSDVGHLTPATRMLWTNRLQFVERYLLGKRTEHTLGPRYDIPTQFLEEQDGEVVNRYIQKLVAIGSNCHEPNMNRATVLESASLAIELLSADRRKELFGIVKPLTDPETRVSTVDEYEAGTRHPLSRFQISSPVVADIRAAALRVLARSAVVPEDRATVVAMAQRWLGTESEVLQQTGAVVLTLPDLSSPDIRITDLADHPNPRVRQTVVDFPNMRQCPDPVVLECLASDPDKRVRIRIVYALTWLRDAAPDTYERIGSLLSCDQSGVVRALAAEALEAANQQGA